MARGQTGADYLTLDEARFHHLPTPIMYHNWLHTTPQDKNDRIVATGWDIKVHLLLEPCPVSPAIHMIVPDALSFYIICKPCVNFQYNSTTDSPPQ
jgi:hypothetical protein